MNITSKLTLQNNALFRNQQYERDADGLAPLGTGYDGDNFPLRKTGVQLLNIQVISFIQTSTNRSC